MGWWKADPVPDSEPSKPTPRQATSPSIPSDSSSCPVDPKTRSIWLQEAQSRSKTTSDLPPSHPPIIKQQKYPQQQPLPGSSRECSSDRISQSPIHPSLPPSHKPTRPLSQERQISSIPRTFPSPSSSPTQSSVPSNSETETGHHPSGNWIYPSESQFYNAVMSKQTTSNPDALLSSISHIIPIHNAVNERAWHLISLWEKPYTSPTRTPFCNGPKLHSFSGIGAGALSPKAKFNTYILGYTEPFDRHDWIVERCDGKHVEYVIDFYTGKQDENMTPKAREGNLNFYLDVRPKLNSWEGWRMRAEKIFGIR